MIQTTPTNYSIPTSVASRDALDASHKSNKYKQMIYDHICINGTRGATCDEIEVRLGIRHQTASCFISVLKDKGMIVASGQTRPARSGRNVTVWTRKFSGIVKQEEPELFQVKPTFRTEVY